MPLVEEGLGVETDGAKIIAVPLVSNGTSPGLSKFVGLGSADPFFLFCANLANCLSLLTSF